jgi:hypothetical protein
VDREERAVRGKTIAVSRRTRHVLLAAACAAVLAIAVMMWLRWVYFPRQPLDTAIAPTATATPTPQPSAAAPPPVCETPHVPGPRPSPGPQPPRPAPVHMPAPLTGPTQSLSADARLEMCLVSLRGLSFAINDHRRRRPDLPAVVTPGEPLDAGRLARYRIYAHLPLCPSSGTYWWSRLRSGRHVAACSRHGTVREPRVARE